MQRSSSMGAGADSIGAAGDDSRASWARVDPQGACLEAASGAHECCAVDSESLTELESMDPLKRELLEARIVRKVSTVPQPSSCLGQPLLQFNSPDSNMSAASNKEEVIT